METDRNALQSPLMKGGGGAVAEGLCNNDTNNNNNTTKTSHTTNNNNNDKIGNRITDIHHGNAHTHTHMCVR